MTDEDLHELLAIHQLPLTRLDTRINTLLAEVERLRVENSRLRTILAPFAAACAVVDRPSYADQWPLYDAMGEDTSHEPLLVMGDVRRARDVLVGTGS